MGPAATLGEEYSREHSGGSISGVYKQKQEDGWLKYSEKGKAIGERVIEKM